MICHDLADLTVRVLLNQLYAYVDMQYKTSLVSSLPHTQLARNNTSTPCTVNNV